MERLLTLTLCSWILRYFSVVEVLFLLKRAWRFAINLWFWGWHVFEVVNLRLNLLELADLGFLGFSCEGL